MAKIVRWSFSGASGAPVTGADFAIPTGCAWFDNGNACLVSPSVAQAGLKTVRIAYVLKFRVAPTQEELACLMAEVETVIREALPDYFRVWTEDPLHCNSTQQARDMGEHFLSGKKPQ